MNDLPLYQILDWNDHFENFRSRVIDRCNFVCVPNKHGGIGLSNLLSEPNGYGLYGIWMLILEMCSRQRKPREGYLTDDGRPSGRRIGPDEIGHIFKIPPEEVRRCLAVCSSNRVGWIRLIDTGTIPERYLDDARNDTGTIPERYLDDARTDTATIPERYLDDARTDTATIPERYLDDARTDTRTMLGNDDERKKERKKESLSNARVRARDGVEEGEEDPIQHTEAKKLIGKLSEDVFGEPLRENQWSSKMDHELDQALPMKRENWELIDWLYRLPLDHKIFEITRRRQSVHSLIENLVSEPQKIRSARKAIGMNGLYADPESDEPWTKERFAAAKELFPDQKNFPGLFGMMSKDERRKIDKYVKEIAK